MKMVDIKNWLGLQKSNFIDTDNSLDVDDVINKDISRNNKTRNISYCFLCISKLNDGVLICIHKDDNEKSVEDGKYQYDLAVKEKRKVVMYNFQNNTFKKWNPISKIESEGNIPEVDYSSLIDVIKDIQNSGNSNYSFQSGRFNRLYFAVIYKLLKDGIFGINNNDMSYRDFVNKMNLYGLDAGQKTNLEEHLKKLEGKSPFIQMRQSLSEKSQELLNNNIKFFVEEIISRYFKKTNKILL